MMPPDTVSLDFLSRQQLQLLKEIKAPRAKGREVRRSFSPISDHFSRRERRIAALRQNFETMIKLQIGGAILNLQTKLENEFEIRLGAVKKRLDLESKLDGLERSVEGKLNSVDSKVDAMLAAAARA